MCVEVLHLIQLNKQRLVEHVEFENARRQGTIDGWEQVDTNAGAPVQVPEPVKCDCLQLTVHLLEGKLNHNV